MTKEEANKEAKKIFEEWKKKKEIIENKAKEEGTWMNVGLDSNNHLFKEVDAEAKEKLRLLESMFDKEC